MTFTAHYDCSLKILGVLNATFFLISKIIGGAIAPPAPPLPPALITFSDPATLFWGFSWELLLFLNLASLHFAPFKLLQFVSYDYSYCREFLVPSPFLLIIAWLNSKSK